MPISEKTRAIMENKLKKSGALKSDKCLSMQEAEKLFEQLKITHPEQFGRTTVEEHGLWNGQGVYIPPDLVNEYFNNKEGAFPFYKKHLSRLTMFSDNRRNGDIMYLQQERNNTTSNEPDSCFCKIQ